MAAALLKYVPAACCLQPLRRVHDTYIHVVLAMVLNELVTIWDTLFALRGAYQRWDTCLMLLLSALSTVTQWLLAVASTHRICIVANEFW